MNILKSVTLTLTWPRVVGMVLHKILDQYVSSYQRWIKSVIRLGINEALKSLTKTLTFVDADAGGSTIALPERCSGDSDLFTILYLRVPGLAWALKRQSYYKITASTTELSAMILWVRELTEI